MDNSRRVASLKAATVKTGQEGSLPGKQRGHLVYVADELARARQALAELVGEQTTEALLGEIFSSFCVGK